MNMVFDAEGNRLCGCGAKVQKGRAKCRDCRTRNKYPTMPELCGKCSARYQRLKADLKALRKLERRIGQRV